MATPAVVVNGIPYDWGGMEFVIGSKIINGGISISYSQEVMVEILKAAGRNPYARTDGEYKPGECEVEMFKGQYMDIIQTLGNGYMMKEFHASISYSHTGDPTITDELIRCRIIKDAHSPKQGPGGVTVKVGISVFRYKIGGLDPVNATGTNPA